MAEIVKLLKILVRLFSARLSWHTGVLTKAVTFEISRLGAQGSYRMCVCVCVVELFIWLGCITETQRGFCHEMN